MDSSQQQIAISSQAVLAENKIPASYNNLQVNYVKCNILQSLGFLKTSLLAKTEFICLRISNYICMHV